MVVGAYWMLRVDGLKGQNGGSLRGRTEEVPGNFFAPLSPRVHRPPIEDNLPWICLRLCLKSDFDGI